eukprot:2005250-Pleurochrysis_carterae.AAC.1
MLPYAPPQLEHLLAELLAMTSFTPAKNHRQNDPGFVQLNALFESCRMSRTTCNNYGTSARRTEVDVRSSSPSELQPAPWPGAPFASATCPQMAARPPGVPAPHALLPWQHLGARS